MKEARVRHLGLVVLAPTEIYKKEKKINKTGDKMMRPWVWKGGIQT
jgi:hypothetical protein